MVIFKLHHPPRGFLFDPQFTHLLTYPFTHFFLPIPGKLIVDLAVVNYLSTTLFSSSPNSNVTKILRR